MYYAVVKNQELVLLTQEASDAVDKFTASEADGLYKMEELDLDELNKIIQGTPAESSQDSTFDKVFNLIQSEFDLIEPQVKGSFKAIKESASGIFETLKVDLGSLQKVVDEALDKVIEPDSSSDSPSGSIGDKLQKMKRSQTGGPSVKDLLDKAKPQADQVSVEDLLNEARKKSNQ